MTPRPHLLDAANAIQLALNNMVTLEKDPGIWVAISASVAEHYKTLLSLAIPDTLIEGVDVIPATNSSDRIVVRLIGPIVRQFAAHEITYNFEVDLFVCLDKNNQANAYRSALLKEIIIQTVTSIPIYGFTGTLDLGKYYGCAELTVNPASSGMTRDEALVEGVSFGQKEVNSPREMFKISAVYRLENLSWQNMI